MLANSTIGVTIPGVHVLTILIQELVCQVLSSESITSICPFRMVQVKLDHVMRLVLTRWSIWLDRVLRHVVVQSIRLFLS